MFKTVKALGYCGLLAVGLITATTPAHAVGDWEMYQDIVPGGGMTCQMRTEWDDGSIFTFFANTKNEMGFIIHDPSWDMPNGVKSHLTFRFSEQEFTYPVTITAENYVLKYLENPEDVARLTEQFLSDWKMDIVFPTGEYWEASLWGGRHTYKEWVECQQNLKASGGGSPFTNNNPFGDGETKGPF